MWRTICLPRSCAAFLEFEPSKVAQVAQTTERVLDLLGRIECFVGKTLEQTHDLLIRAVFLSKLHELSLADGVGHMV